MKVEAIVLSIVRISKPFKGELYMPEREALDLITFLHLFVLHIWQSCYSSGSLRHFHVKTTAHLVLNLYKL